LLRNSSGVYHIYSIAPGLGLSIKLDRLAAFFIAIISTVSICVAVYSWSYTEYTGPVKRRCWLVWLLSLFLLGMVMVTAAADFFSLIFSWEIMSLSSFFLVLYEYEKPENRKAGVFYLVMTQLSTVFLMMGAFLYYFHTGTLAIGAAPGLSAGNAGLIFSAFFIGFGTKAGLIPLHKWLPHAHAAVPSNISALMSGVMIKVAIYGLARLILSVLTPELWWGMAMLVTGIISAVLGVMYALKEHDLKKLLAYHSIENIGIIVVGLGLYVIFHVYKLDNLASLCLAGALFHTLNHALFKSVLFMSAGAVVQSAGSRNIEALGGLVKRMPATAVIFLIGAAAISALPPLNGFASEIMIFQGFLGFSRIPDAFLAILVFSGLTAFALMSALAAACFVKAFGTVFLALPRSSGSASAKEAPKAMLAGPAVLAAACVVLGVFSFQIQRALGLDLPVPDLLPAGMLIAAVSAVTALLMKMRRLPERRADTWDCGIHSLDAHMEYTASGFSEPIVTIFRPIFRTGKHSERTYFDRAGAVLKDGRAELTTLKLFEEKLYLPVAGFIRRMAGVVSRLHNADLDAFIFYAFIVIIVIMLFIGWWL
jgi:hydrogenase-4 component B